VREAPAEQRHGVEGERAWACPVGCAGGARDGPVGAAPHAAVGDGHGADLRGAVCDRRGAGGGGVAVAVPGARPALGVALRSPSGVAPGCVAARAGDGGEGVHGDNAGGSRGEPRVTVCGTTATRHEGRDGRVVRARSAPGVQDPGEGGPVRAAAALLVRAPCEGRGRRLAQGLGGAGVRRAAPRAQGRRDGAGEARARLLPGGVEPRRGCLLRALGPVPVAACVMEAVVCATGWALREALSLGSAWALWEGAEARAVCEGQRGRALQGRWGAGGAEGAAGAHGRSPCLREWRRTEAAACPGGVRWKARIVVARGVCPRGRGLRRGGTPAASRGGAYAWRRGGLATPVVVMPARGVAVRKAPWTRGRLRGEVAGGGCG